MKTRSTLLIGAIMIAAFAAGVAAGQTGPRPDPDTTGRKDTVRKDTTARKDTTVHKDTVTTRKDSLARKYAIARRDTSSRRIKVGKASYDTPEDVDTVVIRKTDTVTVTKLRVDTVTKTVNHVDTMTINTPAPASHLRLPSGFYMGVAGGGAAPWGSLYNPNNAGPSGQVQVGWQQLDFPIGFRVDVNYLRPSQDAGYAALGNGTQSDFLNVSPDIKVRLPYLTHMFGVSPQFSLYALGGGTYAAYRNARIEMQPGVAGYGASNAGFDPGWQRSWGWNAGGGASLLVRSVEIFAESRLIAWTPTNASQSQLVPFVLGINWYGSSTRR